VEIAAERLEGQARRLDNRGACRQRTERRLKLLLRDLQLAGQLRVEIALAIDIPNRVAARLCRARGFRVRPAGLGAQGAQAPASLVERRPRRGELLERVLMRGNAIAIEFRESRGRARCLAQAPDV